MSQAQKPIHSLAEHLPAMTEEAYKDLVTSIKKNGLRRPVVLFEDAVLDGRHRAKACYDLNKRIRYEHFEGTFDQAIDFVIDENIIRRSLTANQRAMSLQSLVDAKRGEFHGNQSVSADSADTKKKTVKDVAKQGKVSPRMIERAKWIAKHAPKIADQVIAGEKSVNFAEKQVKDILGGTISEDAAVEQKKPEPKPKPKATVLQKTMCSIGAVHKEVEDITNSDPSELASAQGRKSVLEAMEDSIDKYEKFIERVILAE